jgi:hypothetical protein
MHGVTFQKTVIVLVIAVRISNTTPEQLFVLSAYLFCNFTFSLERVTERRRERERPLSTLSVFQTSTTYGTLLSRDAYKVRKRQYQVPLSLGPDACGTRFRVPCLTLPSEKLPHHHGSVCFTDNI